MIRFAREAVRILSMSCRDHAETASRELDGPLPPGLRTVHRLHLFYCRDCARFRKQIRMLREAAMHLDESSASASGMPIGVRERLIRRLEVDP